VSLALAGAWTGLTTPATGGAAATGVALAAGDYYVIAEYDCVSVSKPNESQGSCQIETHSPDSCQAAMEAHRRDVAARGDVCRRCVANVTDNTRRANGVHRFKQGGPCQGWQ
jgi:hypothetical protein